MDEMMRRHWAGGGEPVRHTIGPGGVSGDGKRPKERAMCGPCNKLHAMKITRPIQMLNRLPYCGVMGRIRRRLASVVFRQTARYSSEWGHLVGRIRGKFRQTRGLAKKEITKVTVCSGGSVSLLI